RAGVAVVAGGAVRLRGIGAGAVGRVAGAGVVALIRRRADDRVRPGADAGLTDVGLRAGVVVAARGPVGLRRIGAGAGRRVAGAGVVALIRRGAGLRRPGDARAVLAGVAEGAGVVVAARGAVHLRRIGAGAGRRVAGAGVVALIRRGAGLRRPGDARAVLAGVAEGAGVVVTARGAVGLGRGRGALAGRRVARTCVVAVVGCRADDRGAGAGAALTRVVGGAGVVVVARCVVGQGGSRALPGHGVAGSRSVALIERGADDRGADAGAALARVAGRARFAVVARGTVVRAIADFCAS